jgi:hypothetical protein
MILGENSQFCDLYPGMWLPNIIYIVLALTVKEC